MIIIKCDEYSFVSSAFWATGGTDRFLVSKELKDNEALKPLSDTQNQIYLQLYMQDVQPRGNANLQIPAPTFGQLKIFFDICWLNFEAMVCTGYVL